MNFQSKAETFFNLAGQTMESFVRSLGEDTKQHNMDSDESQFVLALAGIVTSKSFWNVDMMFYLYNRWDKIQHVFFQISSVQIYLL